MRQRAHVLLAAVAACALSIAPRAQELVLNPGLEDWTRCPTGIGVLEGYADHWHRGGLGSTDYYNACGYYATPARTGEGHAGLIPWDASGNYREYLVGELASPLEAGREYRVELWVRLHESMLRAVQELGAWFSPTRPSFPGAGAPPGIVPQVENATGPLVDKVNWTLVTGTFVAAGGESFITIGNFRDDASTTLHSWPCCGAVQSYYDVDDVSVVDASVQPPAPCLWRSDLATLRPFDPPHASVFMAETPEGLSLRGPSWQCPLNDGDLETDPLALDNGVPLSFYQVNVPAGALRLEKAGTTIRFRR